eukprot:RCo037405
MCHSFFLMMCIFQHLFLPIVANGVAEFRREGKAAVPHSAFALSKSLRCPEVLFSDVLDRTYPSCSGVQVSNKPPQYAKSDPISYEEPRSERSPVSCAHIPAPAAATARMLPKASVCPLQSSSPSPFISRPRRLPFPSLPFLSFL